MRRPTLLVLGFLGAIGLAGSGIIAADMDLPSELDWFGADAPEQPIAFPHDLHAGTNKIPCMYCHSSADRSVDAGIPSVKVCAGCHLPGQAPGNAQPVVRGDRPGVKQLAEYYNTNTPIPWVRIHDLPDHAHFPHMMHVNAGLQCQQCHGPVETMKEVKQEASLRMGWCIQCHEERKVRKDCFVCHY